MGSVTSELWCRHVVWIRMTTDGRQSVGGRSLSVSLRRLARAGHNPGGGRAGVIGPVKYDGIADSFDIDDLRQVRGLRCVLRDMRLLSEYEDELGFPERVEMHFAREVCGSHDASRCVRRDVACEVSGVGPELGGDRGTPRGAYVLTVTDLRLRSEHRTEAMRAESSLDNRRRHPVRVAVRDRGYEHRS